MATEPLKSDLLISVVTAVRDAADYIDDFLRETAAVLAASFKDYEIVVVDNGSRDDTVAKIERQQQTLANIQLYCLVAGTPRETDIVVGVEQSIGDVVITMDAAYDPPSSIVEMIDLFHGGTEVVYGIRRDRLSARDPYQRLARAFFGFYRLMTGDDIPDAASSFRLMSRRVVNSILDHRDRYELFPVITAFFGFPHKEIVYDRVNRASRPDRSSWTRAIRRGLRILMLGSHLPMRMLSILALGGALFSLVYSLYVIAVVLLKREVAEGWTTLSLQIAGLFFLLFLVLAALSEYVTRILQSLQSRQRYSIARESSSRVFSRKAELNLTSPSRTPAISTLTPDRTPSAIRGRPVSRTPNDGP